MKNTTTQERILRAAVRTLASQGYARSTARAIARTGQFAPGLIYYHFADMDDLFIAAARFTSEARLIRYQAELAGLTRPTELIVALRRLYAEDGAEGHVAAVQELVAAATAAPRLAAQVREETARWEDFAEGIIRTLCDGTPFGALVPIKELAAAAVAGYLGAEMLSHLHAERTGPDALFDAALGLAAMYEAAIGQDAT